MQRGMNRCGEYSLEAREGLSEEIKSMIKSEGETGAGD